jgi:hypothetical protein
MTKITLILLLFSTFLTAQSDVALNISQDARLAMFGDDKVNEALTPNIMARIDLQDNQRALGYSVVGIEYYDNDSTKNII